MREALAATNHDFLLRDDKKRRGGRGKAKRSAWARVFGGRKRAMLFLGFCAVAAIGIPLNALYLQEGRHPAPLFRLPSPEPRHAAARHEETPPVPPSRPAAPVTAEAVPASPPAPEKAEAAHGAGKKRDAIGALLAGGAPKKEEADKSVLAAQQALARLGYPIRADGVLGGATREALEKFERANRMPVTGELTPKLLRRLQQAHPKPKPPARPVAAHSGEMAGR